MQASIVKSLATELGFTDVRVCRADEAWEAGERLAQFVGEGLHGSMAWMEDTLERRKHPTAMWDAARSAVVVAMNYGPDVDPLGLLERRSEGVISVYARNADYHDVMKKRLKHLARAFAQDTGEDVKVFVDTAPLMEKPLAGKAGMGWQGKHTNLVSRQHGSWLFLGEVFTTLDLASNTPETDHCGRCRACLDACPTDAFPAPYRIDARRCISYLTIEHKGPIPHEFRAAMGNRIYGCDDCLAVCPWNKFAQVTQQAKLAARDDLDAPPLADLAGLDDAAFRALFSGSPIKRIGRDRFVRNVLVAIGNSGEAELRAAAMRLLDDAAPLVRGAAVWAFARLDPAAAVAERASRVADESDPDVLEEWHAIDRD